MKRDHILTRKVYQKPAPAGRYLHFKSNHPDHVKRWVIHSLTKVIYQDQRDLNNEIKNKRHDLMLNEYSQEFVESIIKSSRSNCPSDTAYQGTVIPYIKDISKKSRHIGNCFNIRIILKTKHSVEHWWKLNQLEMLSRQRRVCTISHVIVADVT
jgi:hypothetical protein